MAIPTDLIQCKAYCAVIHLPTRAVFLPLQLGNEMTEETGQRLSIPFATIIKMGLGTDFGRSCTCLDLNVDFLPHVNLFASCLLLAVDTADFGRVELEQRVPGRLE